MLSKNHTKTPPTKFTHSSIIGNLAGSTQLRTQKKQQKRRKQSNHINIKLITSVIFGILFVISTFFFIQFASEYKNTSYEIQNIKHADEEKVKNEVEEYLKQKPYLQFKSRELEEILMQKNPLFSDVEVKKSLALNGTNIHIKENTPIVQIKLTNGKEYFYNSNNTLTNAYNINTQLITIHFLEDALQLSDNIKRYIQSSVHIIETLEENNNLLIESVSLGRTGSLKIEIDNRQIFLDLNEIYYVVDDQIKVLQNVLSKGIEFENLDIRNNYLVVRK